MPRNHDEVEDSRRLTMEETRRILDRASRIDAARLSVAELRQAAEQAGITPSAFDQALAELDETAVTGSEMNLTKRRTRSALWGAAALAAMILVALGSLVLVRLFP